MIAGNDEEVVTEFPHLGQLFSSEPDLYKDILRHFFSYYGRLGEGKRYSVDIVPVLIEQLPESDLITFGNG